MATQMATVIDYLEKAQPSTSTENESPLGNDIVLPIADKSSLDELEKQLRQDKGLVISLVGIYVNLLQLNNALELSVIFG